MSPLEVSFKLRRSNNGVTGATMELKGPDQHWHYSQQNSLRKNPLSLGLLFRSEHFPAHSGKKRDLRRSCSPRPRVDSQNQRSGRSRRWRPKINASIEKAPGPSIDMERPIAIKQIRIRGSSTPLTSSGISTATESTPAIGVQSPTTRRMAMIDDMTEAIPDKC